MMCFMLMCFMLMCIILIISNMLLVSTQRDSSTQRHTHNPNLTSNQINTNPIIFLSTREGISSHILQLERLWGKAVLVKRGVQVIDYYSDHYPDRGAISMCDYFTFPKSITCSNASFEEVNKNHTCIFIEIQETWASLPWYYKIPEPVKREPFFNFTDVDCIAGYYLDQGILPNSINAIHLIPKFNTLTIPKHYHMMLPSLLEDLQFYNHSFVALHWRRGDQLIQRCPKSLKLFFNDTSVNCRSVEEFINITLNLIKRENISSNVPVLVATNENSNEVIQLVLLIAFTMKLIFILIITISNYKNYMKLVIRHYHYYVITQNIKV